MCLCSDIQALQRNVSSEPITVAKLTQSKEKHQRDKPPLDNGQYLDIRGVTEMDGSSDTTKTSTTITTATDCTENTTTATQPHSKLKNNGQQSKSSVQFDQPNR